MRLSDTYLFDLRPRLIPVIFQVITDKYCCAFSMTPVKSFSKISSSQDRGAVAFRSTFWRGWRRFFALLLVNKPIMWTPSTKMMRDLGSKGGFCFAVNPIYGLGCSWYAVSFYFIDNSVIVVETLQLNELMLLLILCGHLEPVWSESPKHRKPPVMH